MRRQLPLFSDDRPLPEGLSYTAEFLTIAEERDLIDRVASLPLAPFQFGVYEGKRRVVTFGTRYDFTHQRLEPADELPEWLLPVARRTEDAAGIAPGSIRHALCTEYAVGAGIGWHRDKKQFGEVFGLSLASDCAIRFRRKSGSTWRRFTLPCAARSLYALRGPARAVWEHSIAPVAQTRYSITFRTMAERIDDEGRAARRE
ncbi:MAG: alpha-ketoglutarate-dependent dioxygenase AlkB [Gemmatimonas sp.]